MPPGRVDRDVEITIPLTNRSFQRTSSAALSSQADFIIDDNARTHSNNNNNNNSAPTNSSIPRQLTIVQFVVRSRSILWVLVPECLLSWLFLLWGTAVPLQWQKDRCAAFLADRPPPFQLLSSSGEVVLDPSLNYPLESSQISTEFLVKTAIQIPIHVVWITSLCLADTKDSDTIDILRLFQFSVARIANVLAALSSIFATIAASEVVTQTLKAIVARPRPNFYALCQFDAATRTCTNTAFWRCEAQHSFPSGHSSLTMCAATFLSYFLVSHILRCPRLAPVRRPAIAATVGMLLGWALHVATTRLVDRYHHYDDVLAGLLLGVLVPTITFHLFFPPLWHPHVGTPWSVVFLQQRESAAARPC